MRNNVFGIDDKPYSSTLCHELSFGVNLFHIKREFFVDENWFFFTLEFGSRDHIHTADEEKKIVAIRGDFRAATEKLIGCQIFIVR